MLSELPSAVVFLADGFEEIEACTIVDILRRCAVAVTVAGTGDGLVEGAHGMKVSPDTGVETLVVDGFDAVICPGGAPGYINLRKNWIVLELIRKAYDADKLVAAICAAPAVLSDVGVLKGRECTIYPGMEDEIEKGEGIPRTDIVVVDGNVITSKGPATALPFALKLGEMLAGKKVAEEVAKKTLADIVLK